MKQTSASYNNQLSYLVLAGMEFKTLVPEDLASIILSSLEGLGSVLVGLEEVVVAVAHLGVILVSGHGAANLENTF